MNKPLNIFVEGVGGSGKTTIINIIKEIFENEFHLYISHHFQYPSGNNNDEKFGYQRGQFELMFKFINALNDNNISTVFDRSYIGEVVWSPIYRGRCANYIYDIESRYKNNSIIIHTTVNDYKIIYDRLLSRNVNISIDDPYFNKYNDPIEAINDLDKTFDMAIKYSSYKSYKIFTDDCLTNSNHTKLYNMILGIIDEHTN